MSSLRDNLLHDRVPSIAKRELSPGAYRVLAGIIELRRGNKRLVSFTDDQVATAAGYEHAGSVRRRYPELEHKGWILRRDVLRGVRTVELLFTQKEARE